MHADILQMKAGMRAGYPVGVFGDEDGFTLPELMMALAILAIGIFAIGRVFLSTLAVQAASNDRTRAVNVAAQEIESMNAVPYGKLGFSVSQPGYQPDFDGAQTVIVANPGTSPTGSQTVSGRSYAIQRDIVWVASGSTANAFKRIVVQVRWTDNNGVLHAVRQDAGVFPGGSNTPSPSATTSTTPTPQPPGQPTLATPTLNQGDRSTKVDLSWTPGSPEPETWEVDYSSDGGSTWQVSTTTQPGPSTTYTLSGLSPGTDYLIRVGGITGSLHGQLSDPKSITTDPTPMPCSVTGQSVVPSTVARSNGASGHLASDLTVTANTTGACTSLYVRLPPAPAVNLPMTANGSVFTRVVGKNNYSWAIGPNQTIRVIAADGTTQLAQMSIVVT
jgi:prepilin-type N-terminal cleavage/methylation domain-containing protein